MTIQESQSEPSLAFSLERHNYRTWPEQYLGLGIYLSLTLGCEVISKLPSHFLGTLYFIFLALGMWNLWRRYSLRLLKLELSVFLSQFVFQLAWTISFFALNQSLLALVSLLLLWCNTLLTFLLFWKRERLSGILYLFPLIWTFYLALVNMGACIFNP